MWDSVYISLFMRMYIRNKFWMQKSPVLGIPTVQDDIKYYLHFCIKSLPKSIPTMGSFTI